MSFRPLLAACALAALPASAAAQLPTPSADQVVAAAEDCATAGGPQGVDTELLVARGWKKASMSAKGVEIETALQIYGKADTSPLLMLSPTEDNAPTVCVLTGQIDRATGFEGLASALSEAFTPAGGSDGDRYFRIDADTAVLTPTGSRREPSFRLAVMEIGEKN